MTTSGIILALVIPFLIPESSDTLTECQWIDRADVYDAMKVEHAKQYEITATTNGTRLLSNVIIQLALQQSDRNPDGGYLCINQHDYFESFLRLSGLARETAPAFVAIPNLYSQHIMVEYGNDRILRSTSDTNGPETALNVKTWWADSLNLPKSYSYHDTFSDPELLVINEQVIRYRILDYGDMIVFDEIEGLKGRPTSGLLGYIFKILGAGRVIWSRSALSIDGLQVAVGKARRGIISRSATIVVYPDGSTHTGIPEDRDDLTEIERRLKKDLKVNYREFKF